MVTKESRMDSIIWANSPISFYTHDALFVSSLRSTQIIALLDVSICTLRELTVINESDGQQDSPPGGSWTQESSCVASIRIARRRMMTILSWPKKPPANHTNVITSISTLFLSLFPSFASLTPTSPPKYKLRTKIHYTCSPPTPAKQCLGQSLRERKTLTPPTSTPILNKSTNPSLPSLKNCTGYCGPSSFLKSSLTASSGNSKSYRSTREMLNLSSKGQQSQNQNPTRLMSLREWVCATSLFLVVWKTESSLRGSVTIVCVWALQWMRSSEWMRVLWVDEMNILAQGILEC